MADASDGEINDSVMIAFLPTTSEWCKIDLPHMTLVYAGSKSDLTSQDFSSLVKDAASLAALTPPFCLDVQSLEVFGPDDDRVNVLKFRLTPELAALRRFVERWNKSEFAFNPHATIGPATDLAPVYPPSVVGFDKVIVAWGEDQISFYLKPRTVY